MGKKEIREIRQLAASWRMRKLIPMAIAIGTDGEQLETLHWIETALDYSYISKKLLDSLLQQYASVGKCLIND